MFGHRGTVGHRPPSPPSHEGGNSMWQSYGPWRCRWRACLQAGSRRALSFLHPAPCDKKKKREGWREKGRERARKGGKKNEEERDRGEERPKKKRRVPAPSASPVSFKSDKCAAGNMTEKNNAEGPGGGGGAGCRRDREGRGNGRVGEGGEEGGSRRLGLEKSKN